MLSVKLKNESFTTVAATATLTGIFDVYFVDATAGNIVLTLPPAEDLLLGRSLTFKRTDNTANTVTVLPDGSETIDGAASIVVTNTDIVSVMISSLTGWRSFQASGAASSTSFTTLAADATITGAFDTYFIDATLGNVTVTLPLAASLPVSRNINFKRTDTTFNTVTITRAGADTIDGATSITLSATDILTLMVLTTTSWRSFGYEGATGTQVALTVTATGALTGAADLYVVNIAADATFTLPAASAVAPYRKLSFRRIDIANFAATIARAGADVIVLTNNAVATSTTITASDPIDLVRTGTATWTLTSTRPTFNTFTVTADAPVTLTTNYDVWIAPTLAADRAFTLPLAATAGSGKKITIVNKSAANSVTATRAGADVINAAATTLAVAANTGRTFISDGVSVWATFV
jgi:hypothetical protein